MELNNEQFAAHINNPKEGGGSMNLTTGEAPQGRGFMTAFDGAEKRTPLPATAEQLSSYQAEHASKVKNNAGAFHGAWKNEPEHYTQDLSVQVKTPKEAQSMGVSEHQEAAYALPHTPVSRTGATVGPHGGDVLFHTADLGKNDVDPNYQPGAQDMKGGRGSFTKNQYANKDWDKVGGHLNGQPVSYGEVLRTINKNRVARLRGTGN